MDQIKYQEVKKDYIDNIVRHIQDVGNMFTHIALLGVKKNSDGQVGIIHIPIDSSFTADRESKKEFFTEVVPKVAKKVKEEFDIYGSYFTSEAWMRIGGKDQDFEEAMSTAIKEEVLIIIGYTVKTGLTSEIYNIERNGKKVNSDGDLVDIVTLVYNEDVSEKGDGTISDTYMTESLKLFL